MILMLEDIKLRLEALKSQLEEIRGGLHIDLLHRELAELKEEMAAPGFWDDLGRSTHVNKRIAAIEGKISQFDALVQEQEDLEVMVELAQEENDESMAQETLEKLDALVGKAEGLALETLMRGDYDSANAVLSLHAGAGGTEAQDWAEMLYRMYQRWAEAHDFEVKLLDFLEGDEAGLKSVSFMVIGDYAYGYLKAEMGVHRLVRISPFDSSGRRHTSFASLEVMPELDDSIEINIRSEDLRVDTYRSSGAGGQHVNKTESAIRLTHLPTGVVVSCQTERSQVQNRETAMNMLKAKLYALARAAQMDRIEDLKGNQMEIAWGSQIRSYVFCPYTMVKDHRTGFETNAVDAVMDGDLDGFINAYLSGMKAEK